VERRLLVGGGTALALTGLRLRALPPALLSAPWLAELDVSGCHLAPAALAAPLAALRGLRALNLAGNPLGGASHAEALAALLTSLPPSLEELCVDGTALEGDALPPHCLARLPRLRWLSVAHNALTALPPTWPPGVRYLDASHNALASLPDGLGGCAGLAELRVSGNALVGLPASLGGCARLAVLHAAHNALAELPGSWWRAPAAWWRWTCGATDWRACRPDCWRARPASRCWRRRATRCGSCPWASWARWRRCACCCWGAPGWRRCRRTWAA
jgi:hypothetical protein